MAGDSKHQLRANRFKSRIIELQHHLETSKIYRRQTSDFIKKLISEGRITKEELSEFYKKRP